MDILGERAYRGQFWTHSKTLVEGCSKVSAGCNNCWAEAMARRFGGMVNEFNNFDGTIRLHYERMADILPKTARRKQRVWTYWNDLFHWKTIYLFRDELFSLIYRSPDYHIICTKRAQEAAEYLWPKYASDYGNLIVMVSAENQSSFNERWPFILELIAAGWRCGLLVEPMLAAITLPVVEELAGLHWIVCGPETGKNKRPFDDQWAMELQTQAEAANIPFFYKAEPLRGKWYVETPWDNLR